mgnify:FL=1
MQVVRLMSVSHQPSYVAPQQQQTLHLHQDNVTLLAQPLNVMTPQPSLVKLHQLPQREEFQEFVMQVVRQMSVSHQPSYVAPHQQQTLH